LRELIRVITRVDATMLADALRADGYGVTIVKATGMQEMTKTSAPRRVSSIGPLEI
jgi:hypothetical protein